jgi:hypothetical protein
MDRKSFSASASPMFKYRPRLSPNARAVDRFRTQVGH